MKILFSKGKSPIWFTLCFLLFISSSLYAQVKEGVVRIKLTEQQANYLERAKVSRTTDGYVAIGQARFDAALRSSQATNLKRVFRPAGKFEDKHRKHGLHLWYEININNSVSVSQAINSFSQLDGVQVSEPVYEKQIIGFRPETLKKKLISLSTDPTDPQYEDQWHYNNTGQTGGTAGADIRLPQAWSLETGNPNVVVAVTDGGIDVNHEDLAANMWVNTGEIPDNGLDDDGNGYVDDIYGYGFGDNTGSIPADPHGTHVGGTVAAVTNNGVGVAGVAGGNGSGDGVRLMSCAAFGQFNVGGFAETYIYAADMGAVISQNSWGYTSPGVFEQAVLDAIDYFIAEAGFDELGNPSGPMQGGLVVFAAGNDGSDAAYYPGIYEPVLAVGGTDHNDDQYVFSNRGDWVDVAAPAVDVLSTLPNNGYGSFTGTSMACPHVSGLAGLIISQGTGTITPDQVRARIEQTTDPLPGLEFLGSGRINAFAALQEDDGVAPNAIDDLSSPEKDLSSVTLSWTAPADPGNGSATTYDIRYSTDPIDGSNFDSATPVVSPPAASVAGTPETFTLSGLTSSTTYYFAIKSADFFGNVSEISNVLSVTTDDPPVASVTPEAMTSDLTTGESEVQDLTIANTGSGPLTYSLNFGGTTFTPSTSSSGNKMVKQQPKLLTTTAAFVNNREQRFSGDQYATGFESFTLGDIDGQNDWSAFFEDWSISDTNPFGGSLHIESISEELPAGESFSLAFSPDVGIGTEGYSSMSAKIKVENTGVTWQVIPQSPTESLVVTRVSFDEDGSLSIFDGDVGDYITVPASIPSGYFDLKIIVDRNNFDMNVYIDNALIYVGKAATGDIEQVVLFSLMEQDGNEFLLDDLTIYDGILNTYPFLSASSMEGTVAAGQEEQVGITFDASGLFGGTYENEIIVSTNDPANPSFNVPAVMNVTGTGTPVISVAPTTVAFENTFVGGTSNAVLEITNNGTEILNISDIVASENFGVNGTTTLTILPFESATVQVQFAPLELGDLTGTITISSNDSENPSLEVPVSGTGVDAPSVTITPESLSAELETGSEVTETLTITNEGVAPLEFTIETSAANSESTTVDIIIDGGKSLTKTSQNVKQPFNSSFKGMSFSSDVSLSSSEISVLILSPDTDVSDLNTALNSFPDINAVTYPLSDLPAITMADVEPFDVIVTTNNFQWLAAGGVEPSVVGDILADFIDGGGKVITNNFAYDYSAWALEGRFIDEGYGPFTGTTTDFFGSTNLGTVHAPDHPVMEGVTAVSNSYLWQDPTLAADATLIADWDDGSHFVAANDNVVAFNILPSDGSGSAGWTGDLALMYHNAIKWLGGSGFVSVDTDSGVLEQGESIDVSVTISASGLNAGFYQANIDVVTNDPLNELVQVPVELNVLGPVIEVNPESLEVTVLQGLTDTRTITISNNGSAEANFVLDIVNSAPEAEPSALVDNSPVRSTPSGDTPLAFSEAVNKEGAARSAAGDEVYSTGFENFSIGNINGQQGWVGQFGNWRVENFDPKSGTRHFQGLSDGLGQSVAFTPQLNMTEEAVTSASMDIYLETGASWWISTESSSSINGRIIFDQEGRMIVVSDNGDGGAQLDTIPFSIPEDYFNVAFEVDKTSGMFTVFINEVDVFEGKAFSTDLEYVVVLSQMEIFGPVFNMDNLNVYEGRYVPEFMNLSQLEGVIAPGSSADIEVTFDGDIPYGTYFRDVRVFINGLGSPELVVPATFTVTGEAAIEVTPQLLEQVVNYGESETTEIMLNNTGGQPLDFTVAVLGADLSQSDMQPGEKSLMKQSEDKYERYVEHRKNQSSIPRPIQLMVGETLLEENFEGGTFPPAGWTVVDNEDSGLTWDFLSVHDLDNWSGSGEAAAVNSDANPGVEFDTELITPEIDIEGRTGIAVQYNVNYINFLNLDFLDLDVSTDGGATWTNVLRWNESHGNFFSAPGETVAIELDDYVAGETTMQLRWRYYDPNTGDWDYYVQIDDVEIMADAQTWLTVNPSAGSVPVGQSLPIEATFDASQVDPDTYYAGVLVYSNASNAPEASVFSVMEVLEPAEITVSPASLEETLVTGFSDTQTLSITNNGESLLRYSLGGFMRNSVNVSSGAEGADYIQPKLRSEAYNGDLYTGKEAITIDRAQLLDGISVYGTDFESFATGDINGQMDWFAQFGNWTVEALNPESGDQHFRGLSDGLGQSLAVTPGVGIGSAAVSSFTTDVNVQGENVTWQLVPQSPTAALVVTRLQINPDRSMSALVDDGAGGAVFEQVLESVPDEYFNLKVIAERSSAVFNVFINQELVYTGQGFTGDIEEVFIISLMEEAGPTLDLDDLNIWDGEPPIPFISTNPDFGIVASGETVDIEVTFDATFLEKGIYEDEIIIFNNDPESPEVVVPVTLEVINPPALSVDPESIESFVLLGTTEDHTMTVTNTGEANLHFGIAGYGEAPVPGVFAERHTGLTDIQLTKKRRDDEGSKPLQSGLKPITFYEGEELLYEGFEGTFPPEGWTIVDNEGTGVVFEQSASNYTGGSGNAAIADSDAAGIVEYDTEIITPVIDVDGKAGVIVQYYVNYQNLSNRDFLDLDITTDGGATWTNVLRWNEDHGSLRSVPGEFVSIELDEYLGGATSMQLRWHYYNPNTGDWDWYAQIDEVQVLYEGVQWLTMEPGQGILGAGESMEISMTFDATEVEPGTYTQELLLLTNVPDEPEKQLSMTMHAVSIEDLELATVCSDNPDEERRWEINNPNVIEVDAYWFIVGSSVGDSITLAPGINYFTSPTQTDRPNTVKVQWLDHIGEENEVTAESSGLPCLVENLNLTSMCSNNPDLFRRWRVTNPNPFDVMVTWQVVGTSQSGYIQAAGGTQTFFFTETVDGPNTTIIKWLDEEGIEQQVVKASSGEICDVDNSCYGGEIVAFNQGTRKNGKDIPENRSNPDNALGVPEENNTFNFVSLGFGGSLDIKLSDIVVDQPGDDFKVVETSFNDLEMACEDYPETADVYVSLNGDEYYFVGSTCRDGDFDISESGLLEIQYIRIVDTSDPVNFSGNADGFDVDGIFCINAHFSQAQQFSFNQQPNMVPNEVADDILVSPNPFNEKVEVKVSIEKEGRYFVRVFDVFGNLVAERTVQSSFGQIDAEILVPDLARGTYVLTVINEDQSYRQSKTLIKY